MSSLGQTVYQQWGNSLRFGRVTDEEIREDKWTYLMVDWIDNEHYEKIITQMLSFRNDGYDPDTEWYRRDKVFNLNIEDTVASLYKLETFNNERNI